MEKEIMKMAVKLFGVVVIAGLAKIIATGDLIATAVAVTVASLGVAGLLFVAHRLGKRKKRRRRKVTRVKRKSIKDKGDG